MPCGVRACEVLTYKVFAGSVFWSVGVKNRHFLRKWCSGMTVGDAVRTKIGDSEGQWDLIRLNKSVKKMKI